MAEPYRALVPKKFEIGAALETTPGTNVLASITTPLAAEFGPDASLEPGDFFADGKRESAAGVVGFEVSGRPGTLRFTMDVRPSGPFLTLIQACGWKTGSPTAPNRDFASIKTATLCMWQDGRKLWIYGAAGKYTLNCKAGKRVTATFEFTGIWGAPVDEALPARPTISSLPWVASGVAFTVGGAAIPMAETVTFDSGVEVLPRPAQVGDVAGVLHYYALAPEPKVTADFEARLVANLDAYGAMLAGTKGALVYTLSDGATPTAHTLSIAGAALQRTAIKPGIRNMTRTDEVTFACCISAAGGADELTFAEA